MGPTVAAVAAVAITAVVAAATAAATAAAASSDKKNKECIVYVINRPESTTMTPRFPAPSPSAAPSSARAYEYPPRPAIRSEDLD